MNVEDEDAHFVSLLTGEQLSLRLFVNALLPSDAAAADLAQEASATAWKKRADFVPGTNFRAWVFQIARNHIANHRRKRAHESTRLAFSDRLQDTLASELSASEFDLEPRLQALRHCLQSLRPADRELIQHRYFHQTPLKDYAAQVGRSAGTLKVTLHRIRNSLEQCIVHRLAADGEAAR